MAFTEFCCRSGGSNLNAGTLQGDSTEPGTSASFTYASGSWVQSTGVFTVASGNPSTDGVAVGDFASVYPDAATVTPFVGRITAVSSTTITVSLSKKSGTAPVDGTTDTTLKVGGAWEGPNGTEEFPFSFFDPQNCQNSAGDIGRVNLKNDQVYNVTVSLNATKNFWVVQGYMSSYGDGGRAEINGGTSGASYVLLKPNPTNVIDPTLRDLDIKNNGATGSADGVERWSLERCSISGMKGDGVNPTHGAIECEFYGNGGFGAAITEFGKRCIAHGNGSYGIITSGVTQLDACIAYDNASHGIYLNVLGVVHSAVNCDAYNNGGDGIHVHANSYGPVVIENCNLVKNSGYGIGSNIGLHAYGTVKSCGFGAGTQANTSGDLEDLDAVIVSGTVNYATDVTPWEDPENGDFRINLAAAQGAGHGDFMQSEAGESGTVGYPDIGAAQSTGGGGGVTGYPRSRLLNG